MTNKTKRNNTFILKKTRKQSNISRIMQNWQVENIIHHEILKKMAIFITRCNVLVCFKYCRELATCNDIFIHISETFTRLSFHDIYYKLYVKFDKKEKIKWFLLYIGWILNTKVPTNHYTLSADTLT